MPRFIARSVDTGLVQRPELGAQARSCLESPGRRICSHPNEVPLVFFGSAGLPLPTREFNDVMDALQSLTPEHWAAAACQLRRQKGEVPFAGVLS